MAFKDASMVINQFYTASSLHMCIDALKAGTKYVVISYLLITVKGRELRLCGHR